MITAQPALLHLLHLTSPALPIGAYAYSQGLEYAIDAGWLQGREPIADWLTGLLHHSLLHTDIPLLRRFYSAWQQEDWDAINQWNHFLRACRETRELLLEDEQLGQALARLLGALGVSAAEDKRWQATPCFAAQFALAGTHWRIDLDALCEGFAWSWLENQVAAATKLVPLGQTHAQQLLVALLEEIPPVCRRAAQISDAQLGLSLPGLALASSLHEAQYSRLFRS
jgi:urease accessory protein